MTKHQNGINDMDFKIKEIKQATEDASRQLLQALEMQFERIGGQYRPIPIQVKTPSKPFQ